MPVLSFHHVPGPVIQVIRLDGTSPASTCCLQLFQYSCESVPCLNRFQNMSWDALVLFPTFLCAEPPLLDHNHPCVWFSYPADPWVSFSSCEDVHRVNGPEQYCEEVPWLCTRGPLPHTRCLNRTRLKGLKLHSQYFPSSPRQDIEGVGKKGQILPKGSSANGERFPLIQSSNKRLF